MPPPVIGVCLAGDLKVGLCNDIHTLDVGWRKKDNKAKMSPNTIDIGIDGCFYMLVIPNGSCHYRTLALLRPLRCYAPPPPPLQREVTAKGHFLLPYTPPPLTHAHMCLACSYLNVYSSTTLLLRCYLC